jgi:type III restriction enzyme
VFSDAQLPKIDDGRKPKTNPLNANFEKKEFQALGRGSTEGCLSS